MYMCTVYVYSTLYVHCICVFNFICAFGWYVEGIVDIGESTKRKASRKTTNLKERSRNRAAWEKSI